MAVTVAEVREKLGRCDLENRGGSQGGANSSSLCDLADAIARGNLTARAATENCLAALAGRGRALNHVARLDSERALATAAFLDSERACGRIHGPMHGVPMAHKDMFDRAGFVSRWGSARNAPAALRDAAVLDRLDAAGAIDVGALHMTEFALDSIGSNDHHGRAANPLTPERIAGGSSSGLAGAVAAGLIPAGIGSDTGGSIRIPSAFCGVFGLKPTNGSVSMAGAMPLAPTLDCVGPIARTARDLALMMSVLSDQRPPGEGSDQGWLRAIDGRVAGHRVGLLGGYFSDCNAGPVSEALAKATAHLGALGVTVTQAGFANAGRCIDDLVPVARFESARSHAAALSSQGVKLGEWTEQRLRDGLRIDAAEYGRGLDRRQEWQARFLDEAFADFDILACATVPILAPPVTDTQADVERRNAIVAMIGRNTRLFNYLGLPALNVPLPGYEAGIGLQLIGRCDADRLLLRVAHHLESAMRLGGAG